MNRFLKPEIELLTQCVRTSVNQVTTEDIKILLRQDLSWEFLINTAIRHGVMPLLYKTLNGAFARTVPDSFLQRLRGFYYANVKRNILLTEKLFEILNIFESHGISAIPFKGPAIAAYLYGNIALRQFDDLDILIHAKDVKEARELLLAQGYQPLYKLKAKEETAYIESRFEYFFGCSENLTYLGIHWQVVPKYFSVPIDTESFWLRLESQTIFDRTVRTISPEDLLFVLCLHGTRHLWQRLSWICDIARFLKVNKNVNWDWIAKQASVLGSERIINLGFYLAHDILGAQLPSELSRKIQKDRALTRIGQHVKDWLFQDNNGGPKGLEYTFFHLRARERIKDRVQYCMRLITTPNVKDWAFYRLPETLFALYYLLRPLRLAKDYLLIPLRRLWLSVQN